MEGLMYVFINVLVVFILFAAIITVVCLVFNLYLKFKRNDKHQRRI